MFNRPKPKNKNGNGNGANVAPASNGGGAQDDVICLIPELCFMTGLSEDMRNDFNLKKVNTREKLGI